MNKDRLFDLDGVEYTLEDLLKEIYINTSNKRFKLMETFDTVKPLISNVQTAIALLPEVTKLQQVGVMNDEQLIKMANLVIKYKGKNTSDSDDFDLSEKELAQLAKLSQQSHDISIPSGGR